MQYRIEKENRSLTAEEIKEIKRQEAQERQAEYDSLTVEQKLKRLDDKLGKGKGAKKQRAKLKKQLQKQN